MADSEQKPTAKKPLSDKSDTVLSQGRIQMKPAPKKKREEPVTQAADDLIEDSIDDTAEHHAAGDGASQHRSEHASKKPKKHKPSLSQRYKNTTFSSELACISSWTELEVGKKYMCMSVGATPRSRTGFVLVPLNE